MGFPDIVVQGRICDTSDPASFVGRPGGISTTLPEAATTHLIQVLAQLVEVGAAAAEVFKNLHKDAEITFKRIGQVRERINNLSENVPHVENMFRTNSPASFYEAYSLTGLALRSIPNGGIFIRANAPPAVDQRRVVCGDPPDLNKLNRYAKCLEIKGADSINCLERYSNPLFFFDEWIKDQQMKFDKKKKKRRKKKKKKRKHTDKKIVIEGVRTKRKDQFGQFVYVTKTGKHEANKGYDGVSSRSHAVSIAELSHGRTTDLNSIAQKQQQYSAYSGRQSVYQPGQQTHKVSQTQFGLQAPELISQLPAPEVPGTQVKALAVAPYPAVIKSGEGASFEGSPKPPMAPQPVHNQSTHTPILAIHHPPPPVPNQTMPLPPMAPPPPSSQPQPSLYQPQMPVELEPYAKMLKFKLPYPSIRSKMTTNGLNYELFDFWLNPDGPRGVGTPPIMESLTKKKLPKTIGTVITTTYRRGPGLRRASAVLRENLKDPLYTPPPPEPPSSRDNVLDQIKKRPILKPSKDRVLAPPKAQPRGAGIGDAIRAGVKLKTSKNRILQEKAKDPNKPTTIFEIIAQKQAIRREGMKPDEESSDDSDWDDSDSEFESCYKM